MLISSMGTISFGRVSHKSNKCLNEGELCAMVRFCSKSKNLKFRLKLLIANAILLVHPSYYWATMDKIKIENGYFQRTYNVDVM